MANLLLKDGINSILKQVYSVKGEVFAEIMLNWKQIAGKEYSEQIVPVDIKYYRTKGEKVSSLLLKITERGNHLELQFSQLIILERINKYLGYKPITNIKFVT